VSRAQLALNVANIEANTSCCCAVQDKVWVDGLGRFPFAQTRIDAESVY
jgi:hypothetical protein